MLLLCIEPLPYSVPEPFRLRSCQLAPMAVSRCVWTSSAAATDATVVLNSASCSACAPRRPKNRMEGPRVNNENRIDKCQQKTAARVQAYKGFHWVK